MARKEISQGLQDTRADVGLSSEGELLVPEAGVRTLSGDPVPLPEGMTTPAATITALTVGTLVITDLPTDDPEIVGALWLDGGTVTVSAGPIEPSEE
jgi:hypothetical protein